MSELPRAYVQSGLVALVLAGSTVFLHRSLSASQREVEKSATLPRYCPAGKRVLLWTAPRSGSSVFARSMMQRNDTLVLFERLFDAHYLGPQNRSGNYFFHPDGMRTEQRTYAAVYSEFLAALPTGKTVMFAKDMAYYFVPANVGERANFEWPTEFDCIQHTFLLRSPEAQVNSIVSVTLAEAELNKANQALPVPSKVVMDEIGVEQLHFLFNFIKNRTGTIPVTVDIRDVWNKPEKMLRAYCQATGLDFDPAMLTWNRGWREEFRFWDNGTEWTRDVLNSNGFMKQGSSQREHKTKNPVSAEMELPGVAETIQSILPLYLDMSSVRLVA